MIRHCEPQKGFLHRLGDRVLALRSVRLRRWSLLGGAAFLLVVSVSYARALLAPNSPGWRLRSAEWARDHHGSYLLDCCEWAWYSYKKPDSDAVAAPPLNAFPPTFPASKRHRVRNGHVPVPVDPRVAPALAGEGIWRPVGQTVGKAPVLQVTEFRPDPSHPSVMVSSAWLRSQSVSFVLVPGADEPGGDWAWHGAIPPSLRGELVAAFNSGFKLNEAVGGFYAEGREARALVPGAASLVIDERGRLYIGRWEHELSRLPKIQAVRQSLQLIVEEAAVVRGLKHNRGGAWGPSLNQNLFTWRSGLGLTRAGDVIYVAGDGLTLSSLARALQMAGAETAMQLDIHNGWCSFNVFQPKRRHGSQIIATTLNRYMTRPAERYLTPDDRDFLAVFLR